MCFSQTDMASSSDAVSAEELNRYRLQFAQAVEHLKKEATEAEPYVHQYAARTVYRACADDLAERHPGSAQATALRAHFLSRIAVISHDVEETQDCQDVLEKALGLIDAVEEASWVIIPKLVCLNQVNDLHSSLK